MMMSLSGLGLVVLPEECHTEDDGAVTYYFTLERIHTITVDTLFPASSPQVVAVRVGGTNEAMLLLSTVCVKHCVSIVSRLRFVFQYQLLRLYSI